MFINKKSIIKETKSFAWQLQHEVSEKIYTTSHTISFTNIPKGTPRIRLYLKKSFLCFTYYKFIIGIKFRHRVNESIFPFGGRPSPPIPIETLFKRPGGAGRMHNDAYSIYHCKKNEDQYYVEYNENINTINDLTWMLPYQLFWDNDPTYKNMGVNIDHDILNKLNGELNLNLFYLYPVSNRILKGKVAFKREAYHTPDTQEEYFFQMMMSDRRDSKIDAVLS